jgi:cytochrome oxidase Cu insertion factor (SCO1/SenC/PrrC family)
LNAAFVTVDPDRDAKAKLAKETETEKKRQEWIRSQRWPEHVKQAALKKQPVLGMSTKEASAVLGKPQRVVGIKNTNLLLGRQEQWTYEGGSVLTFTNGIITRIQPANAPSQ